jgi:hypothetical protein
MIPRQNGLVVARRPWIMRYRGAKDRSSGLGQADDLRSKSLPNIRKQSLARTPDPVLQPHRHRRCKPRALELIIS